MTRLSLGTIERIALETAESPSPLLEALREKCEQTGPLSHRSISYIYGWTYPSPSQAPQELAFLGALMAYYPDRRERSRRAADLEAERQRVALIVELGKAVGQIYGQAVGSAFNESVTEALNRKIAAHEPRAGEGRTK